MKKILVIFIAILISLPSMAVKKATQKPAKNFRTQTSLVIEADSGKILHSQNINERIYPASLTKLMTLYVTFEEIKKGNLKLNQKLSVSKHASNVIPLKLNLIPGQTVSVSDCIKGIIVWSANDTSIVLAEAISGNEDKFAIKMNKAAAKLGMKKTTFKNSTGLHDSEQKSTAIDLAKLTLAIKRDFPEFYPWFQEEKFVFEGRTIRGFNKVKQNYPGVEGGKTGFTNPAGFNMIITASREGKNLVAIVTGSSVSSERDKKIMALLDEHFGLVKLTSDQQNDVFASSSVRSKAKKIIKNPKVKNNYADGKKPKKPAKVKYKTTSV